MLIKSNYFHKLCQSRIFLFLIRFTKNNNNNNLYEQLNINKQATKQQIKKAYYKLAQQYHPDKNNSQKSQQKFTQINHAYQILSNQNQRKNYDRTTINHNNIQSSYYYHQMQNNYNMQNSTFQNFFSEIFQPSSSKIYQQQYKQLKQNINVKVQLTFQQSVMGVKKILQYQKKIICSICYGSGAQLGAKKKKCRQCNGKGYLNYRQGVINFRVSCENCQEGYIFTSPCNACLGEGVQKKKIKEEIKIGKGINNQTTLRFKRKGHFDGDLLVMVMGLDVFSQIDIAVYDAVLGYNISVKTIYNEIKQIKIKPCVLNGEKHKIIGQGFYKFNSNEKGNYYIVVKVKIPKKISMQQKQLYERLKILG